MRFLKNLKNWMTLGMWMINEKYCSISELFSDHFEK